MIKTFTRNDTLRYLYGEMSRGEMIEFNNVIKLDPDLQEEYSEQLELMNRMEQAILSPSDTTIDTILNYSRNFEFYNSEKIEG